MITFLNLGKYGRLGNQMFQIASTIGLAIKNGHSYGFPDWVNHDHLHRFNSQEDISLQKYFKRPLPSLENRSFKAFNIDWGYHDIQVPDDVSITGYLQSEKYFMHCRSTILYYFEMHELAKIDIGKKDVAIHVRRGDYDNRYHPRLGMDYYSKAMELFPGYRFFIFSDDIEDCKTMFGNSVEYVEGFDYMTDFYLMGRFSNFIIGNSSFSWWPAWICNDPDKKIVAPSNWFGPAYTISPKDIYCTGWKII